MMCRNDERVRLVPIYERSSVMVWATAALMAKSPYQPSEARTEVTVDYSEAT